MSRYILLLLVILPGMLFAQSKNTLRIKGLGFTLNEKPFHYTGISFFNALYNPAFNESDDSRRVWLTKLKAAGINVLRVWGQWDNKRGFVDTCPSCTLYETDGRLRQDPLNKLKRMIEAADKLDMVVLFVLFQRESWNENIRLSDEASNRAVESLTREIKPYRNVIFQIWNEFDNRTVDYVKIIKVFDSERLVTNSPGYGGDLGKRDENVALDFLSPHTSRHDDRQWEIAPREIAYLIQLYQKPVVDDEPARRGTPKFGGPKKETTPYDHVLRIYNVWKAGGHIIYHHDMFQTGYGTDAIPPSGIPDPSFSPYHKVVFDFLADKERFLKELGR